LQRNKPPVLLIARSRRFVNSLPVAYNQALPLDHNSMKAADLKHVHMAAWQQNPRVQATQNKSFVVVIKAAYLNKVKNLPLSWHANVVSKAFSKRSIQTC
jgi:hypothetical protein